MLSNDEIQKIIDDIESGAYDVVDVLEAIASAAKGEDVRAALYASVYATKNAQINGQPKIVTLAENMTNKDVKYLYLGSEEGYDYGYVYAYVGDTLTKLNLYGEGYSPSVSVTQIPTGVRVSVTDGHGTTTADVENGTATDAQVETYVGEWLDEHPEATTTVEDESITEEKLSPILLAKVNSVGLTADIKEALLACFENVAWIGNDGQDYYDAIEAALYPPANLVSISAVFNSGGATIYNTDSLDDLKQYLTITATFSDLHTETVSNYTLTGSMSAGTQSITVTYGGKTTTFTVTVAEWVTAISATYTQSGTVYDTDNLNSLKNDLVVTATYADTTTGTVSDYALSGTLAEGTSTITVTYVGKTDTFDVTVTHLVTEEVLSTFTVNTLPDRTTFIDYTSSNEHTLEAGNILASKVNINWNPTECNVFQIYICQYDANGVPYKVSNLNRYASNPVTDGAIFDTDANAWRNPGSNYYTAIGGGDITINLPTSGTFKMAFRLAGGSGTEVDSNSTFRTWLTGGGVTITAHI